MTDFQGATAIHRSAKAITLDLRGCPGGPLNFRGGNRLNSFLLADSIAANLETLSEDRDRRIKQYPGLIDQQSSVSCRIVSRAALRRLITIAALLGYSAIKSPILWRKDFTGKA